MALNLLPDADQRQLVESARSVLAVEFPISTIVTGRTRPAPAEWLKVAALGWFGIGIPDDLGGAGLGPGEEVLLFRELGRAAFVGPAIGTTLAAHLAAAAGEHALVGEFVSGHRTAGLHVPSRAGAYLVDCVDRALVVHVGPEQCRLLTVEGFEGVVSIDCLDVAVDLKRATRAPAAGVTAATLALITGAAARRLYCLALVLVAALQTGICEAALTQTLDHVRERKQFGQPIGAFQAVKHRCADMAVQAELAWCITALSALRLDSPVEDGWPAVHSAKAVADRAARRTAAMNVQNHGAMGYTWDHGAHVYVTRAEVLSELPVSTSAALRAVLESSAAP